MKKIIAIFTFVFLSVSITFGQSKQTYIGMKKARAIASGLVAGKIKSAEREKEHGKMIYSFDILGSDGQIHEVTIDAITGAVVSNEVETAADEVREKAEEKKAKKH